MSDENRALAEKPELSVANIKHYPAEYEAYFNDHIPFKSDIVKAYSYINTILLKTSSNRSVILGKDNWLFYDSEKSGDGNEVADYMGTNLYTKEELEQAVKYVRIMHRNIEARGIDFYLFIAPNKSTIYSEYMPDYYTKGSYSKVDQLVDALKEYPEIQVVYPKSVLEEKKDEYQLYYKYDTHWNRLGGYLGTQELLEKMGKDTIPLTDVTITKDFRKVNDLSYMLNLTEYYDDDYRFRIEGYMPEIQVEETIIDKVSDSDYNSIYESNSPDERTVLICRDSFGQATFDFLPSNFQKTVYVHRNLWKDELLDVYEPDIFVFEFVERHSSVLPYFLQDGTYWNE